jgi:photosystem II stability/assembly factor-like uncharacterized protein
MAIARRTAWRIGLGAVAVVGGAIVVGVLRSPSPEDVRSLHRQEPPHHGDHEPPPDRMPPRPQPPPSELAEPEGPLVFEMAPLEVVALPSAPPIETELEADVMLTKLPTTELQRRYRWERTGGPPGGLGYDIRLSRGARGSRRFETMFVTDAWAGVFKRVTGAGGHASWFPAAEGISVRTGATHEAIPVFCLTIDPHDPDVAWAGTKDIRGIFRTTDGGAHWVELDHGVKEAQGISFRGFTVHPHDPGIVYAAAEITSNGWIPKGDQTTPHVGKNFDRTMGVLYRTTGHGSRRAPVEWTEVWRGDNLARYIWIDPQETNRIYVSTGIFDREAANGSATKPGGVGVLRSLDGGDTWRTANDGLGNPFVGSLFMHPSSPKTLLAAAGNVAWNQGGGVYLTTDGASQWERSLSSPDPSEIFTAVELATHPHEDLTIAYAGSQRAIYRSADGGHTWERVTTGDTWGPPGMVAGWPIDFQADPDDPFRVFANAYGGGAFVSTDGGASWSDASQGYTGAQVRALAVDPASATLHAAGRSGIFTSPDRGDSWRGMVYAPAETLDWTLVAVAPFEPHDLLAASIWDPGRLVRRRGARGDWEVVTTLQSWMSGPQALAPKGTHVAWRGIAFAGERDRERRRVFVGTGGVAPFGQFDDALRGVGIFRSDDGGASFVPVNDALSADAHVRDLAVHATDPDLAWAATTNHGLIRTEDGGASWSTDNTGLEPAAPVALSIAVDAAWHAYVGLRGAGLYRRLERDARWMRVEGIGHTASITDVVIDPADPRVVYAADRMSGVYRSEDDGASWMAISVGLDLHEINALAISADGATVYAATEGAGVYRLAVHP